LHYYYIDNYFIIIIDIVVKTWNGEKSFVDREAEQDKINGIKRSFDDEYNEDFDRGVVSIFKLFFKLSELIR